ncbi:tetratricopeptide repeat protein [Gracilibacillus boraciitolerans]|uniref:tetratricopeptide repeat protein n=1 Tax=Gracilibacillus boraciitolerans TaxID=307521 RepID=UPI00054E84F4|nr:hypothetical protein [Gracilibacillus boraciitolerans]
MQNLNQIEGNIIPFIPEGGDFYFKKGVEAYQKQKFDLSLKWLQKALSEKPENPLYQCQTSIVYTEIGSYHIANQMLTKVLSKYGDEYIDCYYLIANNYAHLGLLQDATKYAQLYLEKGDNGEFHQEAEELLELLDFSDEEDDEDWIFEEEDDLLVYQETAFYHLEREEWVEAIAVLEEMIALYPEFSQARHEYHYATFFIGGEREEAIANEEKYLKEHPDALFSFTNLAIFYTLKGNKEVSKYYTDMLVNIYPIHEQQKLRIAVTFAQIGLYEKAMDRFKMLRKSKLKGHPSYYRWYSTCQYYLGMEESAFRLWNEGCKQHSILSVQSPPWAQSK